MMRPLTAGCILGTIVHQAAVLVLGRHEATALALIRAWKGMDGQKLRINSILKKTNAGQTLVGNILIQFMMSYYYIVCFRCGYSGYATTSPQGEFLVYSSKSVFFHVYLWAAVFYYWPWTAGASARGGRSSQQPGHGRRRPSIPQAPHGAGASREWLVGGDGRSEGLRLGRQT